MLLEPFRELQDGSRQRAVINIDDEAAAAMLEAASGVPCITYGVNNARADVRVESLELTLWRTTVSRAPPPPPYSSSSTAALVSDIPSPCSVYGCTAPCRVYVLQCV